MSELNNSYVHDMNGEHYLFNVSKMLRTSLSDTRWLNESVHAEVMVGLGPGHQYYIYSDLSGVARETHPSEGGRDGTSLNAGIDIVGKISNHFGLGPHNAREVFCLNPLGEVIGVSNPSPDVAQDMSFRIERAKVNSKYRNPIVSAS